MHRDAGEGRTSANVLQIALAFLCSCAKVHECEVLGLLLCGHGCDAARPTWTAIACLTLVGELLFPHAIYASASCCGCLDLASHMGEVVGRNVSEVEEWGNGCCLYD